jgi:beta-lactamase superfamily II metal-dependent hydrolase
MRSTTSCTKSSANQGGLPSEAAMSRMQRTGVRVFRINVFGIISFSFVTDEAGL